MTSLLWTKDAEDTKVEVRFTSDSTTGDAIRAIEEEGYSVQEEDGFTIDGFFIGYVFAKFTPWNIAYDFVILSVLPDLELP